MDYLIWSFEHKGWWREQRHGYTSRLQEAGVYDHNDAHEITMKANNYGAINESLVPLTDGILERME